MLPDPPPEPRPDAAPPHRSLGRRSAWSPATSAFQAAAALLIALLLSLSPAAVSAAPGLCVGPVCGDEFSRSAAYHWQLRLRVNDQQGHRERLVVDCRNGALSPERGLVERGHAAAIARRACRLAGEGPA